MRGVDSSRTKKHSITFPCGIMGCQSFDLSLATMGAACAAYIQAEPVT